MSTGFSTRARISLLLCVASPMVLAGSSSSGSTKPAAAAKPAATPAKPPAGAGGRGTVPAGRGPTTATGGRGPTTTTGGRGPTTGMTNRGPAGSRGPTTATVGRGPAAGSGGQAISRPAPLGSRDVRTASGKVVRIRPGGGLSDVHDERRGMDVHRGLSGDRRVEVRRPDGSRIVAERGHRGFVERDYAYRGHEFALRTDNVHGRPYPQFYRPYLFRGVAIDVYEPARFYPAPFYGWVYNPWVAPIQFTWGFTAAPWYGYYGPYFVPAPNYPNASVWLTDYMVSNSLADAYQARVDAGMPVQPQPAPPAGEAPLTPDVKAQIAEEVRRQIALENAEAQGVAQNTDPDPESSGIGRMLADGFSHVFIVGNNLDLVNSLGKECVVTPGDVLQLRTPPPPQSIQASLIVLSDKGGPECQRSSTVMVAFSDLQEMQNHMRETIDQGLGELQRQRGNGIPPAPPSATAPPSNAPYIQGAPPMEPNIATELAQQELEANNAEREASLEAQTNTRM